MSPLVVRRYRADRLLREEFDRLRARVIGGVSGRLLAVGVRFDSSDLDACYSQAWQGLYAAVLDGEEIGNPAAWLALVTYRRAIDEHRSRRAIALAPSAGSHAPADGVGPAALAPEEQPADRRDIAADLDDRARLRQLFEALRARLSAREQQAATLCYLHGLSRADAAARMGISQSRMRKLMEGRGAGSQGVAAKMGALVQTIRAGEWCEQQGSLMRAFAYGVLDPEGERYRLALLHRDALPRVPRLRALPARPRGRAPTRAGAASLVARRRCRRGTGRSRAGGRSRRFGRGAGAAPASAPARSRHRAPPGSARLAAAGGSPARSAPSSRSAACSRSASAPAAWRSTSTLGRVRAPTHRHNSEGDALARTSRAAFGAVAGAGLTGPGSAPAGGAGGAPAAPARPPVAASVQATREFGPEQPPCGPRSGSARRPV